MVRWCGGEGQLRVHLRFFLHSQDAERAELLVDLEELGDVLDYHLAVDNLQSVVGLAFLLLEGAVDDVCQEGAVAEVGLYVSLLDNRTMVADVLIYKVCRAVEYVAEHAVVDSLGVAVRFLYVCYVLVVERQFAAYVRVDSRGREAAHLLELAEGSLVFLYGFRHQRRRLVLRRQTVVVYLLSALHEQLQHEAAHLAGVSVVGGVVVGDGDVAGALQQAVEVVGVEGYLVVDGGESVRLAYGVGYERRVVDALGHVAFVAGEEEEVVEVDVARLEHAHYLYAHNGLAVEGYGRGADELGDESAQRGVVDEEVAAVG